MSKANSKSAKFPLFLKKKIPFKSHGSKKGPLFGKQKGKDAPGGGRLKVGGGNRWPVNKKDPSQTPVQLTGGPTTSKKDDAVFDMEQQFILRMPIGPAVALKHDIQSGSMHLKDKLTIELPPDKRTGRVRYGGMYFKATLFDLPCILESLKTTDKKTFYKAADICQLLICKEDFDSSDSNDETEPLHKKDKDKDKKYKYPHGITPPLKNVRKRRYRKTLQKKYTEQPDIEKEVKRLFRADNEAIDVKWEIICDDDSVPANERVKGETSNDPQLIADSSTNLAEHIFGEVSSSEDDDDEKDVNIMDSEEEEGEATSSRDPETPAQGDMDISAEIDNSELEAKLTELEQQLSEIRAQRHKQESDIAAINNVALRQRFQDVLDDLIREEGQKQKEYELLASMLNQ